MIDWFLNPTLAEFQLYRGVLSLFNFFFSSIYSKTPFYCPDSSPNSHIAMKLSSPVFFPCKKKPRYITIRPGVNNLVRKVTEQYRSSRIETKLKQQYLLLPTNHEA